MNKEKFSHKEEALMALAQGEWRRALEAYRSHCKEEPGDLRSRLKVAELFERLGRRQEALKTYREVAEAYVEEGFLLQAISLFKIMLRIDPSLREASERLAELCRTREKGEKLPQALTSVPLFSELSPLEVQSLLPQVVAISFPKGAQVCRQGEPGDSLFILCRGEIAIVREFAKGRERTIGHLREGDIFGELGFFTDGKRHATLRATTECEVLEISRQGLERVIQKHPRVQRALEHLFQRRVLDTFLALSPLFSSLRPEEREEVLGRFHPLHVPQGTYVFRKGDPSLALYMVRSGEVELSVRKGDGTTVILEMARSGNFFGEIALLLERPCLSDAKAIRPSELLELKKEDFSSCLDRFSGLRLAVQEMSAMRLHRMKTTLSQEAIERAREVMV